MIDRYRLSHAVLCITVAFVGAGSALVHAQSDPMRWGDIPDEHIAMDSYPADSTAAAVVLGSFANVEISGDLSMVQDVHRRVKIFSESAYEMATVEFAYVHRGRAQRLQRLDGQTFVRDADGGFRRVELQRSDIHEEQDGDFTRVRFTLPALEPGAIFEYRYRVRSDYATTVPDWLFQDVEPMLWSEYRAKFPSFITINRHPIGAANYHIEELDVVPFDINNVRVSGLPGNRRLHVPPSSFRWVMTDVPALRSEDFIASRWNHAHGMRFQIAGYYDGNMVYRQLSQTWTDVAERMRDHDQFGRQLRPSRAVRNQVEEVIADAETETEKLHRIYDFVRSSIVWDERYRLFAQRSMDRVLDSRSGSSAEINLLLIAMLRAADIEANPLLLSTRRNGEAIGWFTSTRQFNHVLAVTQADREEYFLDATDPHRPANMLPTQALNVQGWLLTDHSFGWMPVAPGQSSTNVEVEAIISPDGNVSGTITGRFEGYPALRLRHRLRDATDEAERQEAVAATGSLTYTGLVIDDVEDEAAIRFELYFDGMEQGQQIAHLLTIDPILLGGLERSPFSQPERMYPVDFIYPVTHNYVARYVLPNGYEIDELPTIARLQTPGNGIGYARVITSVGGAIRVQRTFMRNQTYFEPHEYDTLREVYDGISAADAGVIVLARTGDEPAATVDE